MKRKNGFTLVEVIVVVVIVAVLAMLAVQLYFGYIRESRKNTAENVAASAAGFLNSAINMEYNISSFQSLNGAGEWNFTMPSNNNIVVLKCPAGVNLTINTQNETVKAGIKGTESSEYKYH